MTHSFLFYLWDHRVSPTETVDSEDTAVADVKLRELPLLSSANGNGAGVAASRICKLGSSASSGSDTSTGKAYEYPGE